MSEKTIRTVRLVCGCVLSALLVFTGLCFILSALSIYQSGAESPYTPEAIQAAFSRISVPVWITLGALLVATVLHLSLPREKKKNRALPDRRALLSRLEQKKNTADTTYLKVAAAERKTRLLLRLACALVALLSLIPLLLYALNFENFRFPEYNESVIGAMPYMLLFSLGSALAMTVCAYLCDRSYQRQTKALAVCSASENTPREKDSLIPRIIRLVLLATALLLLILGITGGGMADVLSKAINICTECIGLG